MGKQINYWLEFDGFMLLAQKALDMGCTIVREDVDTKALTESRDLGVITEGGKSFRYFHFPEAGDIDIENVDGKQRLNGLYNPSGNTVIEASFSRIKDDSKEIFRGRLYLSSGYYDSSKNFIPPPDCIVKAYNSLVRYVKKLAPYTEITKTRIYVGGDKDGQKEEYKAKEYISPFCLDLRENKGYKLRGQ